jgi:hypothetical protein
MGCDDSIVESGFQVTAEESVGKELEKFAPTPAYLPPMLSVDQRQ